MADQVLSYSEHLKPVWTGHKSVTVPIPQKARVFTKSDEVVGVKVVFRQM